MSQWYYAHDGKQSGPVPVSELQRLAANGEFDPEKDLVWQEGLPDWKPASTVPELSSLYPQSPEAPAPAPQAQPGPGQTATPEATPYQPPQSEQSPVVPNKSYAPTGQLKSGLAIASMVCGLIGFLTCFFICTALPCAVAAIILGHMAIARVMRDPSTFGGKGFAKAGLITGYLGLVLSIAYISVVGWFSTRTPEQIEQMDWLPEESKEQIHEAFEKQRQRMEEQK